MDRPTDRGQDVGLVRLADYSRELALRTSAPKVIPRYIWEGLQRAIALRSEYVAWFQRQYGSAHNTDSE